MSQIYADFVEQCRIKIKSDLDAGVHEEVDELLTVDNVVEIICNTCTEEMTDNAGLEWCLDVLRERPDFLNCHPDGKDIKGSILEAFVQAAIDELCDDIQEYAQEKGLMVPLPGLK